MNQLKVLSASTKDFELAILSRPSPHRELFSWRALARSRGVPVACPGTPRLNFLGKWYHFGQPLCSNPKSGDFSMFSMFFGNKCIDFLHMFGDMILYILNVFAKGLELWCPVGSTVPNVLTLTRKKMHLTRNSRKTLCVYPLSLSTQMLFSDTSAVSVYNV